MAALEDMERQALETGDKVEVERIKRVQNVLRTACSVEANLRKLHNVTKCAFLKWTNAVFDKRNKTLLLGNVLLRATKFAENLRTQRLFNGWEAFRINRMGLAVRGASSQVSKTLLEQRANLQSQIDSYNKD